MTGIKPGFRFDINALRAIAVVAVLLYHFHVPLSGGGFSGVDIFFVISGYLMTSIILKGLEKGNFSIMEFYKKRIQRIMPALIFLIVALMISCFFIYLPQDYLKIAENSTASLLFLSNISLCHERQLFWRIGRYEHAVTYLVARGRMAVLYFASPRFSAAEPLF